MLFAGGRPLVAPWPHDGTLAGFGVRLGVRDRRGTRLVAQAPSDQGAVAPTQFGEQAKNPVFGGVLSLRDLSRGMGQRRLRGDAEGRYWYMLGARGRTGYALKGPSLTTYTPATRDATTGVTRFFEVASKIFAGDGRYALAGGTDGTGWTVSKDFGAGKALADVVVAQTNQAASTRYAWVGMGDAENLYYFDGTTWTQTAGANAMKARALAVDHDTLFRVDDANRLLECSLDADATLAASWASSTQRIGTKDHAVTRMQVNAAGSLLIFKADDVYAIDADGAVNRLFGQEQFVPAATNGEALSRWLNDTYVTYGNATYRLSADGGLTQVGPELLRDNGSPVSGYLTAHCGTDFFLLAGIHNPDTGASYLCEFTGEITQDAYGRALPVWHGSITAAFAGKSITAIHASAVGAPAGHKMAYLGFSDGTIATYVLACTPDPADCASEVYAAADGQVFYPRLAFNFPGEQKALLSATAEADNFGGANYATLAYRTWGAGSYVELGTTFTNGDRQRVAFPDSAACVHLDPKLTLVSATTATSPKVTGLSIEYQLRTPEQEVFDVQVLAEDGLVMRDGTPYRLGAADIHARIRSLARLAGGVTFVDPDGDSHQVTVRYLGRRTAYDLPERRPHDALALALIERRPTETAGTLEILGGLTLRQMSAYTNRQLAELSS